MYPVDTIEYYCRLWTELHVFNKPIYYNTLADEINHVKIMVEIGVIPPKLMGKIQTGKFDRLAGLAMPTATKEQLLAITLWGILLVFVDDVIETLPYEQENTTKLFIQAFDDETVSSGKLRSILILLSYIKSLCKSILLHDFDEWWQELKCHTHDFLVKGSAKIAPNLPIDSYCEVRKYDSSAFTFYGFAEMETSQKIPKWMLEQEELQNALSEASLIMGIMNDIYSFPRELSKNEFDKNIVQSFIIQSESINQGIEAAVQFYYTRLEQYKKHSQQMRKKALNWETEDRDMIGQYMDWIENFMEAVLVFHRESTRYVEPLMEMKAKL